MMSRAVLLAWLACSASAGTVEVYLHDFSDSQCTGTIRHARNFTLGVCSTDAETGGNTAAKVSYSWMVMCNSDNKDRGSTTLCSRLHGHIRWHRPPIRNIHTQPRRLYKPYVDGREGKHERHP